MRALSRTANIAEQRANTAEYWRKKLTAQGWETWHDGVAWANKNERGWTDLEKKLDVGGDAMREQCRRVGAEITVDANVLRQR